jgi:predicted O-methyltransferase YrrM
VDEKAATALEHLHAAAKGDRWKIARGLPAVVLGLVRGIDVQTSIAPYLDMAFIPVSPDSGRFLYQLVLAAQARYIVEFGTSYGISTIYLAAAARQTRGRVIGSELQPAKHAKARQHLRDAGLDDLVDIRLGDARQTFSDLPNGIDFVLLDGWKDLYLPMLALLLPKLAPGAIVVADNIHTFRRALRPYVQRMQDADSGFSSVTVPIGAGMEYSVRHR